MRKPRCSQCGEELVWTKAKNIDFHYWKCENEKCSFIYPVWEQELTKSEERFIKSLNKKL